jgi:SnoaL-like domain
MGHIEMAEACLAAVNARQWDTAANYLADDFTYADTTLGSLALGKQGFLTLQKAMCDAARDYHIMAENPREAGDTVRGTVRIEGTQANPLAFPGASPLLPAIPATGKHFAVAFPATVTWRADKIAAIMADRPSTPTIFDQLGVRSPV